MYMHVYSGRFADCGIDTRRTVRFCQSVWVGGIISPALPRQASDESIALDQNSSINHVKVNTVTAIYPLSDLTALLVTLRDSDLVSELFHELVIISSTIPDNFLCWPPAAVNWSRSYLNWHDTSVCWSVCLYPYICLDIYRPSVLSACPRVRPRVCVWVCASVRPSVVRPFVRPSVACPSVVSAWPIVHFSFPHKSSMHFPN